MKVTDSVQSQVQCIRIKQTDRHSGKIQWLFLLIIMARSVYVYTIVDTTGSNIINLPPAWGKRLCRKTPSRHESSVHDVQGQLSSRLDQWQYFYIPESVLITIEWRDVLHQDVYPLNIHVITIVYENKLYMCNVPTIERIYVEYVSLLIFYLQFMKLL